MRRAADQLLPNSWNDSQATK